MPSAAYRRFPLHEHHRHGLSHDVARSDDDDILPCDRNPRMLKEAQHPVGGAWGKDSAVGHKRADIVEIESVDILANVDRLDQAPCVDVRRDR
mgnify:CR=1 FL=1